MTASRMGLILLSSWLFALRARLLARTFAAQLSDFLPLPLRLPRHTKTSQGFLLSSQSMGLFFFFLLYDRAPDMQFAHLFFVDDVRSLAHDVHSTLRLRESNDITD